MVVGHNPASGAGWIVGCFNRCGMDTPRALVGLLDRATLAQVAREPSVHAQVRAAAAARLSPTPVVELEIPDDSDETVWPPGDGGPEEG